MTGYKIRDWQRIYENSETRKIKHLAWVPTRNNHDSLAFRRIAADPRRDLLFSRWNLMLQVASRGSLSERGTLVKDGVPLSAKDLAMMTGFDAEGFEVALAFFSNHNIRWLEAIYGISGENPEVSGGSPAEQKEQNRTEQNEQNEKNEEVPDESLLASIAVARKLATTIHSWKPNFGEVQPSKINRTLTRWAKDIDLAIRLEKRTVQDLEAVIAWLPTHEGKDGFRWRDQILSGAKLREKFDRLEIAMRNGGSNGERRLAGRKLYTAEEVGAHMEDISR